MGQLDGTQILAALGTTAPLVQLRLYEETESTNLLAKQEIRNAETAEAVARLHGTVFFAERQTAGRGRLGRSFYSPKGRGLYCSMILTRLPYEGDRKQPITDAGAYTRFAAVAVRAAIARVTGIETEIKWVNDLYDKSKKLCGILAEGACSSWESVRGGGITAVVLGVGINLYTVPEELPEELRGIVGGLFRSEAEADGQRNRLAAELVRELLAPDCVHSTQEVLASYRAHSMLLGKRVLIFGKHGMQTEKSTATALAVTDEGRLLVRYDDGSTEQLENAEVSVKLEPEGV